MYHRLNVNRSVFALNHPVLGLLGSGGMGYLLVALMLVTLLAGCDKVPSGREMRQFSHSVQQKVVASDLEHWATNCIAKGVITEDGASDAIRQLIREGEVSICSEIDSKEQTVQFWYGGGFGHWGIIIGAPTYTCTLGNVRTHWTNGIWFWHD